jgi:hypothetical protein
VFCTTQSSVPFNCALHCLWHTPINVSLDERKRKRKQYMCLLAHPPTHPPTHSHTHSSGNTTLLCSGTPRKFAVDAASSSLIVIDGDHNAGSGSGASSGDASAPVVPPPPTLDADGMEVDEDDGEGPPGAPPPPPPPPSDAAMLDRFVFMFKPAAQLCSRSISLCSSLSAPPPHRPLPSAHTTCCRGYWLANFYVLTRWRFASLANRV